MRLQTKCLLGKTFHQEEFFWRSEKVTEFRRKKKLYLFSDEVFLNEVITSLSLQLQIKYR